MHEQAATHRNTLIPAQPIPARAQEIDHFQVFALDAPLGLGEAADRDPAVEATRGQVLAPAKSSRLTRSLTHPPAREARAVGCHTPQRPGADSLCLPFRLTDVVDARLRAAVGAGMADHAEIQALGRLPIGRSGLDLRRLGRVEAGHG